ncbi:hypothetical protein BFP72_10120 [Reichenbachiella sp. 5M10]|uniref:hypothetical protein n=1 Tax=Reichenbachiella sp. 5M10 TaxID=1889772 RepID=UPI000C15F1DA|nr:hypothetical protein [Reichenbachiella sp. 5M10]PIB35723.1 hypothetical protein BFP72_10120 [Reichenbachiella sp. 5M10]
MAGHKKISIAMKTYFAIISLIVLSLTSCGKEDSSSIVGEWRLTKLTYWGIEEGSEEWSFFEDDYSNYGVTYTFLANGTLKIDAGNNPDWVNNTANYEFGYFPLGGSTDPEALLVKIDGSKWTYSYDGTTMILGKSYVDGADYHFDRK